MNIGKCAKYSIVTIALLCATPILHAQESGGYSLAFHWGLASPVGGSDFTRKTSYMAPQFEYEYRFVSHFSAGLSVGVTFSDEKGRTNDRFGNDAVTGNSHRKLTLLPIQAAFRYFPLGTKKTLLQPYLGIAAGMQYAQFYLTADAINSAGTANWSEVLTPHCGVRYRLSEKGLYFNLYAHWQFSGNDWSMAYSKSQTNIGVAVGVGYAF